MNSLPIGPDAHERSTAALSQDAMAAAPAVDASLHMSPRAARMLGAGSRGLGLVAGGAILLLMFATVLDVVSRKAGGGGLAGVVEWTEVLLVVVVYAAMMGAELSGAHIRGMSFLTDRQRSVVAPLARSLGSLLATAVLVWAVVMTGDDAWASIELGEYRMGLVQVPIWPAKLAIPIGLAGFAAVMLYRAFDQGRQALAELRRRRSSHDAPALEVSHDR